MRLRPRTRLSFGLVGLCLIAIGIGFATPASPNGSLIGVSRVEAAFRPAPLHLNGVVVLASLPLADGDLAEYKAYAAKSLADFKAHVPRLIATLTVFRTVASAQRASVAIERGGECAAHPSKRYFSPWAKCDHLRVGNVLLIMSSGAATGPRVTLTAAMQRLGPPTVS